MTLSERVVEAFEKTYRTRPLYLVRAPGRVNLIGEHTDYNDGFVLPMAIDRAVWIALRPRADRRVIVRSLAFDSTLTFSLDDLQRGEGWSEYVKGVAWALQADGTALTGWEGVLAGDVPIGAGLSSSAAVEMATARVFFALAEREWDPRRAARAGQRAENGWLGVNSGIMDQMVCAAACEGHAFLLDCRSLEFEHVPLPEGGTVMVLDTTTRRGLMDSAYNERRAQCEAAARALGVRALRDASLDDLASHRDALGETVYRRARHVVSENRRVLEMVVALRAGDLRMAGRLFRESHASLREDFEVTNDALDWIVEAACAHPACYGARMTGAGFGGAAVALVATAQVREFAQAVRAAYHLRSGLEAEVFPCRASAGAEVIRLG